MTSPSFNLFGTPTKDDIRVGYISTDRGLISNVTICEANDYAKLNPGTVFIFRDREKIQYLGINEVNKLEPSDLIINESESCDGISVAKTCSGSENPQVVFGGGGGVGAKANPVIVDGSVVAVDMVESGFGYQYPPIVNVKDPCSVGAGVVAKAIMENDETTEFVVYDDEDDFENYEICDIDEVTYGSNFSPSGKIIGGWDPRGYLTKQGVTPFEKRVRDYIKFIQFLYFRSMN